MNYLNLAEVAKYLRLSRIMVYKLLGQGKIPAMKIGRVWRFSREEIDQWMGSKRAEAGSLSQPILQDFSDGLRRIFRDRLKRVVLYGSQARGEATPQSDLDLLVVLDQVSGADRRSVSQIAYQETFGKNRPRHLSTVVISEGDYLTAATPLLINIRREGRIAA